jgi:hypothetical protein
VQILPIFCPVYISRMSILDLSRLGLALPMKDWSIWFPIVYLNTIIFQEPFCKLIKRQAVRQWASAHFQIPGSAFKIPIKWKADFPIIGFSTGIINVDSRNRKSKNGIDLNLEIQFEEFRLYHPLLSLDTIVVNTSKLKFRKLTLSGKDIAFLASGNLNKIPLSVFGNIGSDKHIYCKVNLMTEKVDSDLFFGSLPDGIFKYSKDFRAKGSMNYRLSFQFDFAIPDSVRFESDLSAREFYLMSTGKVNLTKINHDFIQEVFEEGRYLRAVNVGPSNSFYYSLDQIPNTFVHSVLTAEDGSFLYHRGFDEDAVRKALIENISKKKFVRGGSTISMQLVKNVFLSGDKVISRKLEEAMLVWVIEHGRVTSKKRMLEVYLNLIEFGPGIYGIGEAAQFYFSKTPDKLSLTEGLFLTSIIPRPRKVKYAFNRDEKLKENIIGYFKNLGMKLVAKGIISVEELNSMNPDLNLSKKARELLFLSDSTSMENMEEPVFLDEQF